MCRLASPRHEYFLCVAHAAPVRDMSPLGRKLVRHACKPIGRPIAVAGRHVHGKTRMCKYTCRVCSTQTQDLPFLHPLKEFDSSTMYVAHIQKGGWLPGYFRLVRKPGASQALFSALVQAHYPQGARHVLPGAHGHGVGDAYACVDQHVDVKPYVSIEPHACAGPYACVEACTRACSSAAYQHDQANGHRICSKHY